MAAHASRSVRGTEDMPRRIREVAMMEEREYSLLLAGFCESGGPDKT